ncbi:MAG TPA: alpha/beta fold hydrolase [Candidatus Methylomirabilis sp.]|nr:alpha/beta fold hydrolase [Candidatus Methylomirabilis sp.]
MDVTANGTRLHVEDTGGPGPPVVFAHGVLYSCRMWDAQVAALRGRHRCIAYDHRGQGQSAVPESGYDMETVAEDAAALLLNLGTGPVHFVGLSMGGFVGMRLAARRPELIRSLVLLDTSADPEPAENLPRYRMLATIARWLGQRPVAGSVLKIMHGRSMRADPARTAELETWRRRLIASDRTGAVRAVRGVFERLPVRDELGRIRIPTLVGVGEEDTATVPARAEAIAAAIPGARLVRIPRAGHMSPIDNPGFVSAELLGFLAAVAPVEPPRPDAPVGPRA